LPVGAIDASDKIWAFMMLELNDRSLQALRKPAKKKPTRRLSPRPVLRRYAKRPGQVLGDGQTVAAR
jgi:hypothetical protein